MHGPLHLPRLRVVRAAAAALAVVVLAGCGGEGSGRASSGDSGSDQTSPDTVTELAAPAEAAYGARCRPVSADLLAGQDLAVDATVSGRVEDAVDLRVDRWYAGPGTDRIEVRAPARSLEQLVLAVHLEEGQRYLVSALDGRVSVCGLSDRWSKRLAALYEEAFEG